MHRTWWREEQHFCIRGRKVFTITRETHLRCVLTLQMDDGLSEFMTFLVFLNFFSLCIWLSSFTNFPKKNSRIPYVSFDSSELVQMYRRYSQCNLSDIFGFNLNPPRIVRNVPNRRPHFLYGKYRKGTHFPRLVCMHVQSSRSTRAWCHGCRCRTLYRTRPCFGKCIYIN